MTWREKQVVFILLLIARIFSDDPVIAQEIKNLSNRISIENPKVES